MKKSSIKDLTAQARSIRVFDRSKKVSLPELWHLIECARITPSAANLQVLKYRLCYEDSEVDALFPLTRWAGFIKDRKLPPEGKTPTAYIVICHDLSVAPVSAYSQVDVGVAAQTINLAARELGIGCCMIGSFSESAVTALFNLSTNLKPVLILALGFPEEKPILCDPGENGDVKYYRDAEDRHFVPKRSVEELIIK